MDDKQSPEAALWWALSEWPTVLNNSLVDASREELAIGLVESLKRQGWEITKLPSDVLTSWAAREAQA